MHQHCSNCYKLIEGRLCPRSSTQDFYSASLHIKYAPATMLQPCSRCFSKGEQGFRDEGLPMRRRAFFEAQRVAGLVHNKMIRKLLLEQECRNWFQSCLRTEVTDVMKAVIARGQNNDAMSRDPRSEVLLGLHGGIEAWRQSHGFSHSGVGRGELEVDRTKYEGDRSRGSSRQTGENTGEASVQRLVADEVARRLDLRSAHGTSIAPRSRNDSGEARLEERLWRRCEDQLSGAKAGLSAKAAALDAALAALENKMLMRVEDMRAKTLRECTKKCEDQQSSAKAAGLGAEAEALGFVDKALAASESKMLMRVEDMLKDMRAETTRESTKVRNELQTDVTERLASASAVISEKLMQVVMSLEKRLRKSQETATREQEERNERLSSELELLQVRQIAPWHA